ncbi:MAG: hypothetical protein WDN03_03455 [Rhizomicrobium sp.]
MSPEIPTILALTVQKLNGDLAENGAAFAQGQMGLIGTMLNFAAKEYERGADIRVTENAELRALFAALAPDVADAALKAKLEAAAATRDESLLISKLNENNYALRRLLTEAQIHAEDRGDSAAQQRIWTVLKAMAARRLVSLAP